MAPTLLGDIEYRFWPVAKPRHRAAMLALLAARQVTDALFGYA